MKNTPKKTVLSICIPTYNRSHILPRAIQSILKQRFEDWELIIVDDGSTDDTENIVEEFLKDSRIKYVKQQNKGVCAARNLGAEIANGTYLVFLDSDDSVSAEWLYDFYNEIISEKAHLVRCKTLVNGEPETDHRILLTGNYAVLRDLFLEVGQYDENLKFGENTELQWRINAKNPRKTRISKFNLYYDIDDSNNSSQKKENQIDFTYYVLKKHQNLFKKNKRWAQMLYQIAGVNCIQLGRLREGKKNMWLGYFSNPKHGKSLFRAIKYSFKISYGAL